MGTKHISTNQYRFIKSKTNGGEYAKQYFQVIQFKDMDPVLMIIKYRLTKDIEESNQDLIKRYKEYGLYRQVFSIKVDTLNEAMKMLNNQ